MNLKIDPTARLTHLPIFWMSIGFPVFVAIALWYLGAPIELCCRFDAQGYTRFLEIVKLPGLIASIAIPFGLTVTRIHASAVSAEQIRLVTAQNNFSNYYKHIEEFEKYVKHLEERAKVKQVKNIRKMYIALFPGNSVTALHLNASFSLQFSKLEAIKQNLDNIELPQQPERPRYDLWQAHMGVEHAKTTQGYYRFEAHSDLQLNPQFIVCFNQMNDWLVSYGLSPIDRINGQDDMTAFLEEITNRVNVLSEASHFGVIDNYNDVLHSKFTEILTEVAEKLVIRMLAEK